jgi:formylmethanofuran:tetrahydromethanopterin formyltransferase
MRSVAALAALFVLGACDAPDLEQAGQDLAAIGGQAIETASGAVDTRTACMLAGQSDAFCGCVQERLGARITPERVEDVTSVVTEAVQSGSIEGAAQSAQNIDPVTREALLECGTHAAVQGALGGESN